ncbi:MAG: PQQ-binding-like beta-propeller repeat protein [Planctomycetota bacterium]
MRNRLRTPSLLAALMLGATSVQAQNFGSLGGTPARDGRASTIGPRSQDLLWRDTANTSLISWMPYISDGHMFTVRQSGFPAAGGSAGDEILCYDLDDGTVLWRTSLPYGGNPAVEFIAWIAGADSGRVYAARTQNQRPGPLRALDASTGALLWDSTATIETFAYDGAVFMEGGDLIVGDAQKIVRIEGATGATVWETPRFCPVSGNCGVAVHAGGVYFDQPAPGGSSVGKLDATTGAVLYESAVLPGFTAQNSPFVAPDGTVYFARSQNNPAVDFLYAFDDDGTSLTERWSVPTRWTTGHEHGVAADGSVYTLNPQDEFVRLDPATGQETANAGVLSPLGNPSPHTVVDPSGTVYLSNGFASSPLGDGRLWAFSPDLTTEYFSLSFQRQNQGGPALGGDGILVVADTGRIRAFRAPEVGSAYCGPAVPNSTGASAELSVRGSEQATNGDLVLRCSRMPQQSFGYFLTSRTQGFSPMAGGSQGNLCLGGSVGRFSLFAASSLSLGSIELRVDLAALPQPNGSVTATAGETWNFQCWFRDSVGGQPTSNFSDAVATTFL